MLGHKLRRLREKERLTQVAMAERLGVSPSYLNLIEHNQRALNRKLLSKLAERFDIDLRAFSGDEESHLLAEVTEILGDPLFADLGVGRAGLGELVGMAPEVCRAFSTLYGAYRNADSELQGLSERLAQDPYLSESSHQLLTLLTSIRSFAEILQDNRDLGDVQRQQFVGILVEESEKLTGQLKQLFEFIANSGAAGGGGPGSPVDEVTDLLHRDRNHFPELEEAAEILRQDLKLGLPAEEARLARALNERGDPAVGGPGLVTGPRPFELAESLARIAFEQAIDLRVSGAQPSTGAAEELYRRALTRYGAAALLMPYEAYREAARALRHDIDLLCRRFAVSFEQACHRLTTLSRPGAEGVPFHFLRIDVAGNVSKRFSASGLRLPRYGGVCPRWNAHAAFMNPGRIERQLAHLPDGSTYFTVARSVIKDQTGFGQPASHYSVSLGCEVSFAPQLVYSDGLDLDAAVAGVPVGVQCRLCEREDCRQRAFPALLR